jgi:YVTN family beta-propeller protein
MTRSHTTRTVDTGRLRLTATAILTALLLTTGRASARWMIVGNADTVSVIDLTARPPHVIDSVSVGDGPEGLAISPDGRLAVAVLIRGSQNARANPATAWAAHKNGSVAILSIDGKRVRKTGEIEVGGMPEGVVFSPDGRYIYIGNFLSRDVSILEVSGRKVVDTGERLRLPGQPGAMRSAR